MGGINSGLLSSSTDEWATPMDFFRTVAHEFGPFDVDVCANAGNAKAPVFFTRDQNGLDQEWAGRVWMNPPYGKMIGEWVAKAADSARGGGLWLCA
jgi:phage N-6-adenine-methyltransferase